MKNLLFFLLLPFAAQAQDITGVWVGILHNDSTQVDLHYELIITEKQGKLSGYSFTNFIVDGQSLTGVKSLKITRRFGKLQVEDEALLYNNYPFEPPKGVKQLSTLALSDEGDILSGKFVTSRTKQYGRPVTGSVFLLRKNELADARIGEVLHALNLTGSLSFLPQDTGTPPTTTEQPVATTAASPATPTVPTPAPTPAPTPTPVTTPPTTVKEKPLSAGERMLATRTIETIKTIFITSDSLQLELYDNGYVDGDSVSILLNTRIIMQGVRLSEKKTSKTIHLTPEMGDSIHMVMFAENLGTIAPNTGLLILRDGQVQHNITFSGDLKRNAAIMLRRKRD